MPEWRNWAGDQACAPAAVERPGSAAEVAAAVQRAAAAGRTVRVAGSGHSFSDVVLTDGLLLSLDRMDRVLDVDRASGLVRAQPGITLRALNVVLAGHGLALANLGDFDGQALAGAIATGTHGTGIGLGNLSTQVEAMELVAGDGSTVRVGADDPEALRAARVGLGALGVMTELTLRCVPAFALHAVDEPRPLAATLDALDDLVDGNDHFELFTFPHTGVALTKTNNRTDRPPRPPRRARRWVDEVLLENAAFGAVCRVGRARPAWIPRLNRFLTGSFGRRERVDASHRIFATERRIRFTEMEYAVPRAHGREAVERVLGVIEDRGLRISFPLEVRFVAGDDSFLSPAHGRDTCYVAVHVFSGMEWEPYFRAVEEALDDLGGRPHWGKRHFRDAAALRGRYPEWDAFQAVRRRLDPEGRFANAYVTRVLG